MSLKKIYVTLQQFCKHDDSPMKAMIDAGFEVGLNKAKRRLKKEELPGALAHAVGVVAGVEPFDDDLFLQLPDLRVISRCGAGTDAIDLEAAEKRGITVLATRDEVVEPVAQMTVSMILALARNLPSHHADFLSGQWKKKSGFLLSEWTVGIVGFGRIGRGVERLLRGFGPKVLTCDPALGDASLPDGVERRELADLLAASDLVTLHANRDAKEGPMLGRKELSLMREGARLVNTARGHLVDEEALHEALVSGRLSGAAMDVFSKEPYSGPLAGLPQVLCTPHVSTLTRASRAAMELRAVMNAIEFFKED